jgi:membrane protease YdiL (CAAX protease family)
MRGLRERLVVAAFAAVVVFLAFYFPKRDDQSGAILGGVFAFCAMAVGLAAVADVRPLPRRSTGERARLMGLSLLAGGALGVGNLMANYGIAMLDPAIHTQMTDQWSTFSAWSVVFAGPMVEEIGFRLVLMGGTAWLVSRFTRDRRIVVAAAVAISAMLFGVAHILPSSRPTTGAVHAAAVALKSSAAGVVLAWVFWRRGLPYSIACHGVANAVHLLAWRALFRVP